MAHGLSNDILVDCEDGGTSTASSIPRQLTWDRLCALLDIMTPIQVTPVVTAGVSLSIANKGREEGTCGHVTHFAMFLPHISHSETSPYSPIALWCQVLITPSVRRMLPAKPNANNTAPFYLYRRTQFTEKCYILRNEVMFCCEFKEWGHATMGDCLEKS